MEKDSQDGLGSQSLGWNDEGFSLTGLLIALASELASALSCVKMGALSSKGVTCSGLGCAEGRAEDGAGDIGGVGPKM